MCCSIWCHANDYNIKFTWDGLNNNLIVKKEFWCKHVNALTWCGYLAKLNLEDRLKLDKMGCLTPSQFITKFLKLDWWFICKVSPYKSVSPFTRLQLGNSFTCDFFFSWMHWSLYKFKDELFLLWNFLFCPNN